MEHMFKSDNYSEMIKNEYEVMKPKKISKSEHRKRKRKKIESVEKNNGIDNGKDGIYTKERKRVNAKSRKMSFLVVLLATISGLKVKTVSGFNPWYAKLDQHKHLDDTFNYEVVHKSFPLEKVSSNKDYNFGNLENSVNDNDPNPGEHGNGVINDEGTRLVEITKFILKGSVVVANLGEQAVSL